MIGATLADRYGIIEQVGQGGMGQVFRARDAETGHDVAIKLLRYHRNLEERLRFRQEAAAMTGLVHPAIARIFSIGEHEGTPYIVLEWLEGDTLAHLMKEESLSIRQAAVVVHTLAGALDFAHRNGVVHRDVKPHNVLVSVHGGDDIDVKLVDFGVALLAGSVLDDRERALGTVLYMAPEQLGALPATVDHRADLFGLGVLFYELVTGRLPHEKRSLPALIVEHMTAVVEPPHKVRPQVPPQLANIVMRLLEREPRDRYQSAKSLAMDLERWLADPDGSFDVAARGTANQLATETPLVGRARELNRLQAAWSRAQAGSGRTIVLHGAEGLGKTRLLEELRTVATQSGGLFLSTPLYESGIEVPYSPFETLLEAYLVVAEREDSLVQIFGRLRQELGPLVGLLTNALPTARAVLGDVDAPPPVEPALEVDRQIDVVARALLCLGTNKRPVVLALDDAHLAGPTTRAVVHRTSQLIGEAHALLVVAGRASETEEVALPDQWSITLEPFSASASQGLIAALLQTPDVPIGLVEDALVEHLGNPRLIIEDLHLLVAAGSLAVDEAGWRYTPSEDVRIRLSETFAERLGRALNDLPDVLLDVLAALAVHGSPVPFEVIVTTMDSDEPSMVLDALQDGVGRRYVARGRTGDYHVPHQRLRQLALARRTADEVAELHRGALRALESHQPEAIAQLAHHAQHATDADAIARYAPQAGDAAAKASALDAAIHWYNLAAAHGVSSAAMSDSLARCLFLVGRYDESVHELTSCLEQPGLSQARRLALREQMAEVQFARGERQRASELLMSILRELGRPLPPVGVRFAGRMSLTVADELKRQVRRRRRHKPLSPIDEVVLRVYERLTLMLAFSDPIRMMLATLEMLRLAHRHDTNRYMGIGSQVLGFGMVLQGQLGLAERYFDRALEAFTEVESLPDLAFTRYARGFLRMSQGRLAEAYDDMAGASASFRRLGDQWKRFTCASTAALAAWLAGDVEQLHRAVAVMMDVMGQTHSAQHELWASLWDVRVRLLAGRGKPEDLDELVRIADELERQGDPLSAVMSHQVAARLAVRSGELDQALVCVEKGLELLATNRQNASWLLDLHTLEIEIRCRRTPREAQQRDPRWAKKKLKIVRRWANVFPVLAGTDHEARAWLALSEKNARRDEAIEELELAIAACERAGVRMRAWRIQLELTRLLAEQDDERWVGYGKDLLAQTSRAGAESIAGPLEEMLSPTPANDHDEDDEDDEIADFLTTSTARQIRDGQSVGGGLTTLCDVLQAERAVLFVPSEAGDDDGVEALHRHNVPGAEVFGPAMRSSRAAAHEVLVSGSPLVVSNADPLLTGGMTVTSTLRSMLVAPVAHEGRRGVLYVDRPLKSRPFGESEIAAVERMVSYLAPGLLAPADEPILEEESL